MGKVLTEEQTARYRRDGYLYPIPALSPAELGACRAGLARFEDWLGRPVPEADKRWRSAPYVFMSWADALVRHPRILDAVEDLIGPDILVYTATFFIKEAQSPTFAAWHQDATYFGLDPHEHVTAWVAFSGAGAEAGCMEVVSSHGAPQQLRHAALGLEHSINGGGQAIVEEIDDRDTEMMQLAAGSFSLHHTLCPHRSAPNRAGHRRVGLGISYIPTRVRTVGSHRLNARLVRGTDKFGHFDLLAPPEGDFHPAALARHAEAYRRYRANYAEQIEAHDRLFAVPA